MRKIMFVGRSESGKTTIMQAMKGKPITYHKTQYVNNFDVIIDTPGEYAETKQLSGALAVYGCEADIIGLLMSAIEPFSLYPPNVVSVSNREVVGVVTKCDHWAANPELAAEWLRLAGCKKIFFTSAYTGEVISRNLSMSFRGKWRKQSMINLDLVQARVRNIHLGYKMKRDVALERV